MRTKIAAFGSLNDPGKYYFSGKNGGECDFIVLAHGKPSCIQVSWELKSDKQELEISGLLEAMDFFNMDAGTILTFDTEDIIQTAGKKIEVIPVWKYEAFHDK